MSPQTQARGLAALIALSAAQALARADAEPPTVPFVPADVRSLR